MHLMDKENNGYCIIGLQMTCLAHVFFSIKKLQNVQFDFWFKGNKLKDIVTSQLCICSRS